MTRRTNQRDLVVMCSWSGKRFACAVVNAHTRLAVARLVHFLGGVARFTWTETSHNLSQFAVDLSTQNLTQAFGHVPNEPARGRGSLSAMAGRRSSRRCPGWQCPHLLFCLYSYAPAYFLSCLIPRINKNRYFGISSFFLLLCILFRALKYMFSLLLICAP